MSLAPGQISPKLVIATEPGRFETANTNGQSVTVQRVRHAGPVGPRFNALIYKSPVHEDTDGASTSFAPPISATNLHAQPPRSPLDHINNATNQVPPRFNANGNNSFRWTGVVHLTQAQAQSAGVTIDNRLFLRDANGTFPVIQPAGAPAPGFYVSPSAVVANATVPETDQRHWVDATAIPFGALGGLRAAGVGLRDFGLAIRPSTGMFTGFLYADAGGANSLSVGEFSRFLIRTLFGGPGTNEEIAFLVFPGSGGNGAITTTSITAHVRAQVAQLSDFVNVFDIAKELAFPGNWRSLASEALARTLVQNPQLRRAFDNIMKALGGIGYARTHLIDL